MQRKLLTVVPALSLVVVAAGASFARPVTIEYWQYFFRTKIDLIDELIDEFEAAALSASSG